MADVLLICIREEDKDDFTVELIKGLMSKGLIVSYTGIFYCEREDRYVYDSVTDLLFFASAYYREMPMKKKEFKEFRDFIFSIDFDGIDAKLVIFAITHTPQIDLGDLEDTTLDDSIESFFIRKKWTEMIAEMIKSSCEEDFSYFKHKYSDIVEILDLNEEALKQSRKRVIDGDIGTMIEWSEDAYNSFEQFVEACAKAARKEHVKELEQLQQDIERECRRYPSRGFQLIQDFFKADIVYRSFEPFKKSFFFLNILREIPKKKLILSYEEKSSENKNLYYLSVCSSDIRDIAEKNKIFPIPLDKIRLEKPRELYSTERIRDIIDNYVILELHPSLIDIYFPGNDFLLEIDPEEPEIGFLSRRINRRNCETIEEKLRIDSNLRKRLRIYKWDEENVEFQELESGNRKKAKNNEKTEENTTENENIFIVGRIEHLYRIFLSSNRYSLVYQRIYETLKFLAPLAVFFLALGIFRTHLLHSQAPIVVFLRAVITLSTAVSVLFIPVFLFWAARNYVLNYILEPIYSMLKSFAYSFLAIFLVLILILSKEVQNIGIYFLVFSFFIGIYLHRKYIISAVIYELNDILRIIGHNDILRNEDFGTSADVETRIIKCGRFQTIVRENDNERAFFNSELFSGIKYISKKSAPSPQEIAYSSGILFSSPAKEENMQELMFRKPQTWGFWRNLESFLFGKGQIESRIDSDRTDTKSARHIYFGWWSSVTKHIANAFPIFPQSILFRNLMILIILSGLLLNAFLAHHLGEPLSFRPVICIILVSPFIYMFLIRKLKLQAWEVLLLLIFLYLLALQPPFIKKLTFIISIALLILFEFLSRQILYSIMIWGNERIKGNLVSIVRADNSLQGTGIQRNFLVTRLIVTNPQDLTCPEEEIVCFNKQFFNDIVKNNNWIKIRENQKP